MNKTVVFGCLLRQSRLSFRLERVANSMRNLAIAIPIWLLPRLAFAVADDQFPYGEVEVSQEFLETSSHGFNAFAVFFVFGVLGLLVLIGFLMSRRKSKIEGQVEE